MMTFDEFKKTMHYEDSEYDGEPTVKITFTPVCGSYSIVRDVFYEDKEWFFNDVAKMGYQAYTMGMEFLAMSPDQRAELSQKELLRFVEFLVRERSHFLSGLQDATGYLDELGHRDYADKLIDKYGSWF